MADNVNLASPTGLAACDEVTYSGDTSQIQLIRNVHVTGTEGSKTVNEVWVAEDAAHSSGQFGLQALGVRNDADAAFSGTDLDYTPVQMDASGKVVVCETRGQLRISVQSGGLTTATTTYSAGDQVGSQFTLANAARKSGSTGRITNVVLVDVADIIQQYEVIFFRASVTLASDNAAFSVSDSDMINNLVDVVSLIGSYDLGGNRVAQSGPVLIPYDCSGGTSLYAALLTRANHTFFAATTDLQLIVTVERD